VWKDVSDLYKYKDIKALREELVKSLYVHYNETPKEVEFYLMQLMYGEDWVYCFWGVLVIF
jgi:hypothetical protein